MIADDRGAEVAHLGPEIVEVVLARDAVAGRLEHAAEEVAHERAARVADVERPGGVGRHELHVDPLRRRRRDAAPRGGLRQDRRDDVRERCVGHPQVEEARRARPLRRPRWSPDGPPPRSARRPAPPRSAAAPSGTAGPASSRGSTRGHRDPGSPGARSRSPGARSGRPAAARRQPSRVPRRPRARRAHASGAARTLRARLAGSRCLREAGSGARFRPQSAVRPHRSRRAKGTVALHAKVTTAPLPNSGALVHETSADLCGEVRSSALVRSEY